MTLSEQSPKPSALPAIELDGRKWSPSLLTLDDSKMALRSTDMTISHLSQLLEALDEKARVEVLAPHAGFIANRWREKCHEAESRASRAEARVAELEAFVREHGKTILCARVDAREGPSMPTLFTAAQKAMVPLVEWQEALAREKQ